jgi:MFS family permease
MTWVFILEIPTGTVADFLGRKMSIILAFVMDIICTLVYVSYPSFIVFLAGEFLFAVSYTLMSGADHALVYDSLKEAGQESGSKSIFMNMESFKIMGIVIGGIAGSFMTKYISLRMIFFMHIVPAFIGLLYTFTLKEPVVHDDREALSYRTILFDGVKYFRQHKIIRVLTLDMVVVGAFSFLIIWLYQPLLKLAGIDIVFYGFVAAGMCVLEILIIQNFGRIEKLLRSKKRLLFLTTFATGLSFVVLGLTNNIYAVLIGILVAAAFGVTRGPLFINYINKYTPSNKRATVISTTSMFRSLALVVLYPLIGFLADTSIYLTLLIIGILLLAFSFVSRVKEEHLID